jgi:hypothetical protein
MPFVAYPSQREVEVMRHVSPALAAGTFAAFLFAAMQPGHAEAPAGADGRTSEWFKSLVIPGPNGRPFPCCDESDCNNPVDADWHDGQWWAYVNQHWWPVPDRAVVPDTTSIFDKALVCLGPPNYMVDAESPKGMEPNIYCFVRPFRGN